jgi:hypothetical protein
MTIPDRYPKGTLVPWDRQHHREHAASVVAAQLGVRDLFPVATIRQIEGRLGSVQELAHIDAAAAPTGPINADAMQRMRVFDFIIGNRDRHHENAMWLGGTPVLIDHGLSFPNGPPDRFRQPDYARMPNVPPGLLHDDLLDFIGRIDEAGLSASLHAAEIEDEAIRHTLYRVRALKADPDALRATGDQKADQLRWHMFAADAKDQLTRRELSDVEKVLRSAKKAKR